MYSGSRSRWQKGMISTTLVVIPDGSGLLGVMGVCGPCSACAPVEVGESDCANELRRRFAKKEPTCRLCPHPPEASCC